MNTQPHLTAIAKQQYKIRKPILYWTAYVGSNMIAANNSIPLLRKTCEGIPGVTFHSVV